MKRKILAAALAFIVLCGCGSGKNAVYTLNHVEELLNSDAFDGGEMLPVDVNVAANALYKIDAEAIVESSVYIAANSWTSADELAFFVMADEQAAKDVEEAFRVRVKAQLEVMGMYAPASVPRLEDAFIGRRGNTVLLVIGDPDVIASIKSIR